MSIVILRGDLSLKYSELAQHLFVLDNDTPLHFKTRPFLKPIYDIVPKDSELILYMGRQTGKSTIFTHKGILHLIEGLRVLYAFPYEKQLKMFHAQKLKPNLHNSDIQTLLKGASIDNIFLKQFNNGSLLSLVAIARNPESARGFTMDALFFDEAQDLTLDAVYTIKKVSASSPYQYTYYAGTAKSETALIHQLWEDATQIEWGIKCDCGHINFYNTRERVEKAMSPEGLKCLKCGKIVYPLNGQWYRIQTKDYFVGFRVPQVLDPTLNWNTIWNEYLLAMRTGQLWKFLGEVFAIATLVGSKVFTETQLMELAIDDDIQTEEDLIKLAGYPVYIGVDWGFGMGVYPSYTVVTFATYDPADGRIRIKFYKKFPADVSMPDQKDWIIYWAHKLNATVWADWGAGHALNLEIRKAGVDIYECYWSDGIQYTIYEQQREGFLVLNRSKWIEQLILLVNTEKITFPNKENFSTVIKDFLALEINPSSNSIRFTHPKTEPDDAVHSTTYALIGIWITNGLL